VPPVHQQDRDEEAGNQPDHQGGGDGHDLHSTDRTVAAAAGRCLTGAIEACPARSSSGVWAGFTGRPAG
jgi:hypothetical protein